MNEKGTSEVFPGARIDTNDPRYATMVQGFNPRWVAEPECVQVCGDATQVIEAVQRAYGNGQRVTVRSGGHCYEDFACDNRGGVLIDLSPMNGVYREATDESLYCVEGGATLWNVYGQLYREYGVTLPGGSCYSVGAGGHFTGGGYGLLSRMHGLVVDYLQAVEVVRVDAAGRAEAIVVERGSADEDSREIAWAHTGGGGGNFGIATRFWFKDPPPAPRQALISNVAWDWDALTESSFAKLVGGFGEFCAANSDPQSEFASLFSLLHLNQYSGPQSQIVLTTQVVEPAADLLVEFLGEVAGALPKPTVQRVPAGHLGMVAGGGSERILPWLFATQELNGDKPNQRGKYKSAYMIESFSDAELATMWKFLREQPSAHAASALLQVDSYGCQVNATEWDETAVPQRSSAMKLQYQDYWLDPAQDEENLDWIRRFYGEMYGPKGPWPSDALDGCFVNYPDVDLEGWEYLYYKESYSRLQRAKELCDPLDVFHHRQSIKLPS
jgi:FAD/FMN-containing dehydrogenase